MQTQIAGATDSNHRPPASESASPGSCDTPRVGASGFRREDRAEIETGASARHRSVRPARSPERNVALGNDQHLEHFTRERSLVDAWWPFRTEHCHHSALPPIRARIAADPRLYPASFRAYEAHK